MEFFLILSLRSAQKIRRECIRQRSQACALSMSKSAQASFLKTKTRKAKKDVDSIYSTVVLLADKKNYAFLVLGGIDSAFQLTLEKGKKNSRPISVSLYKNGAPHTSSSLHRRLDWELACLDPGHYLLHLDKIVAFKFQIRA